MTDRTRPIEAASDEIARAAVELKREQERRAELRRLLVESDPLLWRAEEHNRDGDRYVSPGLADSARAWLRELPAESRRLPEVTLALGQGPLPTQTLVDALFAVQERLLVPLRRALRIPEEEVAEATA